METAFGHGTKSVNGWVVEGKLVLLKKEIIQIIY